MYLAIIIISESAFVFTCTSSKWRKFWGPAPRSFFFRDPNQTPPHLAEIMGGTHDTQKFAGDLCGRGVCCVCSCATACSGGTDASNHLFIQWVDSSLICMVLSWELITATNIHAMSHMRFSPPTKNADTLCSIVYSVTEKISQMTLA
ncbi:hypothetical protein XENTR_v10013582 [Xenopus tropicalis]|nr:hypothetical protein XENTR_v10013582 [Xenopus tropicalis]